MDAKAYGLPVTVFVRITLNEHTGTAVSKFEVEIHEIPEVLECYVMTGASDYFSVSLPRIWTIMNALFGNDCTRLSASIQFDTSFVYGVVKKAHVYPDIQD